jgi:hypothetical protein
MPIHVQVHVSVCPFGGAAAVVVEDRANGRGCR